MINTTEGLKIVKAVVSNFQGLDQRVIEIDGRSIVIVGKNGGHKSALLRAIQTPLNSKVIPEKPITDGEDRANVEVYLQGKDRDGQEIEYKYQAIFNGQDKKGKIFVKDSNGNKIDTRQMQKDILGDFTFDIDQFIRMGLTPTGAKSDSGVKKQIEVLKSFLTKDEQMELAKCDKNYEDTYNERTDLNREVKRLQTLVKQNPMDEDEMELYSLSKEKEKKELEEKIGNLGEAIKNWNRIDSLTTEAKKKLAELLLKTKFEKRAEQLQGMLETCKVTAEKVDEEGEGVLPVGKIIESYNELNDYLDDCSTWNIEIKELEAKIAKGETWLKNNPEPEMGSLSEKLVQVNNHQDKHKEVLAIQENWKISLDKDQESQKLTKKLEEIKESKQKVFKEANLPVKGLSFDDEGIFYNELPFDEDHHPTSHILSVGVKIAMAMNPNLKCIFIKDGSMFDKETFKKVVAFIEKNGYQLFIEMVDWSGEKEAEVQFTEEFIQG